MGGKKPSLIINSLAPAVPKPLNMTLTSPAEAGPSQKEASLPASLPRGCFGAKTTEAGSMLNPVFAPLCCRRGFGKEEDVSLQRDPNPPTEKAKMEKKEGARERARG